MATNGDLNDMEQWRSVVEYQERKPNPAHHWRDNPDVSRYLDEWLDEIHYDVRGPYQSVENARRQASRDAATRSSTNCGGYDGQPRISIERVVRVYVDRAALAWEPDSVRDPVTGKWVAA
ncbi:hypothetical protein ACIP88_05155 [Streptomyces uncialis]|uniref:hypothetical protein n=1 Tax=Streptomyces uncialis TaxID=1048205 RepID=UPI003826C235